MAEAEISRIAGEATERWPLHGLTAIHRHGKIAAGRNIVLVVAASAHRQAAFEAATFLMDYLKSRAPFWKKEHRADGTEGGWVEAKETDDKAAARWKACRRANKARQQPCIDRNPLEPIRMFGTLGEQGHAGQDRRILHLRFCAAGRRHAGGAGNVRCRRERP